MKRDIFHVDLFYKIILSERCYLCGEGLFLTNHHNTYPICDECRSGFLLRTGRLCRICSMELVSETDVCSRCRGKTYSFDSIFSLFTYEGRIRELIRLYKTANQRRFSRLFAEIFAEVIRKEFHGYTLVPVPFRKSRKRKRGWDQVEEICRWLHRVDGFRVQRCLQRIGSTSQKSLDYSRRMQNLRGNIKLRRKKTAPEKVMLIDDIFTTGATGDACAELLKSAGAQEVKLLTIAID